MTGYIAFADPRFRSYARGELAAALSGIEFEKDRAIKSDRFLMFSSDCGPDELLATLSKKQLVFTDMVIPLLGVLEASGSGYPAYSTIEEKLTGLLGKKNTFKIEAMSIDARLSERAKDIEVLIGRGLEKKGFKADLKKPECVVYLIFFEGRVLLGLLGHEHTGSRSLDRFRTTQGIPRVNRAELKLAEAVDFFGIPLPGVKNALDIGAAPGGWTDLLVRNGVSVVAVDPAVMDLELPDEVKSLVMHIKQSAEDIGLEELARFGKFGMLLIDANIEADKSAELACKFSSTLRKGAWLVLTIKLVDTHVFDHINKCKAVLERDYDNIRIKKLPHNRMEITCSAIKR